MPGEENRDQEGAETQAVRAVREAEGTEPEAGRTGGRADGRTGWDRWRLSGWGASGCLSKAQRSLDTVLAVSGEGDGEGTVTERRLGLGRRPEPQRSLRPPLTPSLPGGRAVRSRAASLLCGPGARSPGYVVPGPVFVFSSIDPCHGSVLLKGGPSNTSFTWKLVRPAGSRATSRSLNPSEFQEGSPDDSFAVKA